MQYLLEVLNKEVKRLDRFEAHTDLWLRDGAFDDVDAAISWHLTNAIEAVEPDGCRRQLLPKPPICLRGNSRPTVFTVACCFKRAPLEVSLELGLRKLR
jgi:hypothetical protein